MDSEHNINQTKIEQSNGTFVGFDAASSRDKRAFPRIACNLSVDIHAPTEDALLFTAATNLSASGIFVRVNRALPIGAPLKLTVKAFGGLDQFDVNGIVVRHSRNDGSEPRGIGVLFAAKDLAGRARAARLVRRLNDPPQSSFISSDRIL